jgi:2-hydroxychromene-2-carboxylate isomerase
MADPIEFWFEFSSPYGYLAAREIEALGARHGRAILWKPFLLGVVMKETGGQPLLAIPLKGDYSRRDMHRVARAMGCEMKLPDPYPFLAVAASRATYWLLGSDEALAKRVARALYDAAFLEGRNLTQPADVAEVAAREGVDPQELLAAIQDQAIKDRLRDATAAAMERGVFGSPFVIIDGEPFWGFDKLPEVERWIVAGGW